MNPPAGESTLSVTKHPGRRALLIVAVATPLLSAAISVLLVLSILHFLTRVPNSVLANGTVSDPRILRDFVEPYTQNGKVPVTKYGDVVYYPIPYATTPHLTLTSKSEDCSYAIVRQDEFGFAWAINASLKDLKDAAGKVKDIKDLQDVGDVLANLNIAGLPNLRPGEEFSWEAKGVRPFSVQPAIPPFVQKGTIVFPARDQNGANGQYEAVEYFPHPFASSPNVTVSLSYQPNHWDTTNVKILLTTPIGFRWQGVNSLNPSVPVKATWTAKGVQATAEQAAEFGRNPPQLDKMLPVVEDRGKFSYVPGEEGVQSFSQPFAAPPNVEVSTVIVTEITARGFKWKHPGPKSTNSFELSWTAKGVPDVAIWKKDVK